MSALAADPIETALRSATVRAIRKRAAAQRQRAVDGTVAAGEQFPGVMIRSRQAATAAALATGLAAIADELEAEARP
jgi:hypothetical protein